VKRWAANAAHRTELGGRAYFLAHFFVVADHMPPAFSQSACVVNFERSVEGLAAGEPDVLLVPDPEVELLLPDDVDGVLPPALPDLVLPEPLVLDCAAAIAGAKAMTATTRMMTSLCIRTSSESRSETDNAGRGD
jgi:hypothetical protein